jgi:phenylalanyl-tRNA synthetase alpha chain
MKGDNIQSAFWDLDALFVPQDHPAREMQDTFYLDKISKLPKEELEKVKQMHLGKYGKGWGAFDEEISKKTLLRTHTTVLTALKLANLKKEDLPKKFFTIGKVFRNEALDWKHLFEFHQVEGIVIDEKATLVTLKSYLKEYFKKMGYSDVRIRPAYFPYTEPSMEVDAYHPQKKEWFEVGGAGIIRPEITKSLLGFEAKVLAWGLGMERIISSYYNITDIRELYSNNIKDIKEKKMFIR